jgi:Cu(I)/Ag(I) efflux system membrane protein CusA/SilA
MVVVVTMLLTADWLPLGPEKGFSRNTIFLVATVGLLLGGIYLFMRGYARLLRFALEHKAVFMALPVTLVVFGLIVWLGFDQVLGWVPAPARSWGPVRTMAHAFPGLGKEFMPPLDEGSYLFMPTTMPHASLGEALDVLQKQDMAMLAVPEIDGVVGKLGRAESALDPAPISMFETVVNYRPQFFTDEKGRRMRFKFDAGQTDLFRDVEGTPLPAHDGKPYRVQGRFERDAHGALVPDARGAPFRLWRPALDPVLNEGRQGWAGVQRPDDIWDALVKVTAIPGTTYAPRLQPIAARIVMLQSGMRAPLGVKVKGPDLDSIEKVGLQLEEFLKQVPSVRPDAVVADRMVGKPYLEIQIDRKAIARYGLHIAQVQEVLEVAVGGVTLTSTVEGRERYPVRVRYPRELRDSVEALAGILVPTPQGAQIPLTQLADIRYVRGPQVIKSEDTFLVGYVIFDRKPGRAEVDVVEECRAFLKDRMDSGEFVVPDGVSYAFAGSYLNQVRATRRLAVVLPLSLLLIFIILYLQFRSTGTALMVFSGIGVAWMGGFLLLWAYGRPGFLDVTVLGTNLRDLFMVQPVNLSVAVWVGFLALFGIASDDGVLMATALNQRFAAGRPTTRSEIRAAVVEGAQRRIRPALMTSATTLLALLPVLTSTGRGADIMIPMAIPVFGGMVVALITVFVVPVLYCTREEVCHRRGQPARARVPEGLPGPTGTGCSGT